MVTPVRAMTVVVGGGPAGVTAALACARSNEGRGPVLLVEQYGFLGGASTGGLVGPWMTFHGADGRQVVTGIPEEIVRRLVAIGGSPGHIRDALGAIYSLTPVEPSALKFVLDDMLSEAGVKMLLHSHLYAVEENRGRIEAVYVSHPGGTTRIEGDVFVDATGDGELCALAGAKWEIGRPEDGLCQAMTLIFRMGNVETGAIIKYMNENPEDFHSTTDLGILNQTRFLSCSGFFSIWRGASERGVVRVPRDRVLLFSTPRPREVLVNTTRVVKVNPLDPSDLTRAEIEARTQVRQLVSFFRDSLPGFGDAYLVDMASRIGVRESRRITGDYALTGMDVLEGARFPDGVCAGAYPIDIHDPSGAGLVYRDRPAGYLYSIPYRCLVPEGLENVLVAGRCISATHEAQASVRVTATCMAMGQVAGAACAIAPGGTVRDVRMGTLRDQVERLGGFIID